MPLLRVTTNQGVATSEQRRELLGEASARVAELLGKPERYVMVALNTDSDLLFAGDDGPAAFLELASLGLPQERTEALSAALCEWVQQRLGVPADRVYIHFQDVARPMWGTNGTTFG
jgi:phenylpyruvate tautomerase PptA (4-oxalocrotonate tautomerase family)